MSNDGSFMLLLLLLFETTTSSLNLNEFGMDVNIRMKPFQMIRVMHYTVHQVTLQCVIVWVENGAKWNEINDTCQRGSCVCVCVYKCNTPLEYNWTIKTVLRSWYPYLVIIKLSNHLEWSYKHYYGYHFHFVNDDYHSNRLLDSSKNHFKQIKPCS